MEIPSDYIVFCGPSEKWKITDYNGITYSDEYDTEHEAKKDIWRRIYPEFRYQRVTVIEECHSSINSHRYDSLDRKVADLVRLLEHIGIAEAKTTPSVASIGRSGAIIQCTVEFNGPEVQQEDGFGEWAWMDAEWRRQTVIIPCQYEIEPGEENIPW